MQKCENSNIKWNQIALTAFLINQIHLEFNFKDLISRQTDFFAHQHVVENHFF